jgi:hypothetical protein
MKYIKLFEQFISEATQWYDLKFNSHKDHNPECDILEGHLDRNSLITYGIYVNGPKKGEEFMEYYSGPNYKPESVGKNSRSKHYKAEDIPAKYKKTWEELKDIYENDYIGGKSTNEGLKAKTPNEVITIDLDMGWDDSNPEEDKAAKAAFKKYKIKVEPASHSDQEGTFEVTGKKKDILAYLQSEFYEMDADAIEEFYPELLEGNVDEADVDPEIAKQ